MFFVKEKARRIRPASIGINTVGTPHTGRGCEGIDLRSPSLREVRWGSTAPQRGSKKDHVKDVWFVPSRKLWCIHCDHNGYLQCIASKLFRFLRLVKFAEIVLEVSNCVPRQISNRAPYRADEEKLPWLGNYPSAMMPHYVSHANQRLGIGLMHNVAFVDFCEFICRNRPQSTVTFTNTLHPGRVVKRHPSLRLGLGKAYGPPPAKETCLRMDSFWPCVR